MTQDIWYSHLLYQDKLLEKDNLTPYTSDQKFISAKRILDLGTGYGYHLFALAKAFPDKDFIGLDIDSQAIKYAKDHYNLPNLQFLEADIESHESYSHIPPQDYIIARLLLQHLSSVHLFASALSSLLSVDGGVLVIDVHESSKQFFPAMPEYKRIFLSFREWQQKRRGNKEILSLPVALKEKGFKIVSEIIFSYSTDTCLDKEDLYNVLSTNLTIVEDAYGITGDYKTAREELQHWRAHTAAYGSLGLYYLRAVKEAVDESQSRTSPPF